MTNKITTIYEYNVPTNFLGLVEKGVTVKAFEKGEHLDTFSQAEPDATFDFKGSKFQDQRKHGMDHKAVDKAREYESRIFSQFSKEQYESAMRAFENSMFVNTTVPFDQTIIIIETIEKLIKTADNLKAHQIVWAENLHHFPKEFIPPLQVPKNFSTENLEPEILKMLQKSEIRMTKISNILWTRKIPENDFKKAIELFYDSEVQKILAEG